VSGRASLHVYGAIAFGGAGGTLARAGLLEAWPVQPGTWPWATFVANVAGAFLLGLVATHLKDRAPFATLHHPLLGVGFCGGLTTFSTLDLEVLRLVHRHCFGLAAGYLAASVACGLAAVLVATVLARKAGR
jgi:CrcB protein